MYRIYRHSITPQGPHGRGQHFPWEQCLPQGWFSTAGWAARHPQPASLQPVPAWSHSTLPPAPHEEPHELRLRRGSDPSGHTPHVREKKYTPLNTEHMGKGRDAMGEEEAGTLRGGWAEPPASPEGGTASRSHYKRRKSYTQRGGGRGQSVPFIHNIVNIHSLYYMCFSLVFACLSVSQSQGWISGASPCYTSQTTFLPTLETEPKEAWSPSSEGTSRQGCSTLAPESSVCVWVCICMYVHGGPVCKYVQGGRGDHCHRGWSRGLLEARPAWTASS